MLRTGVLTGAAQSPVWEPPQTLGSRQGWGAVFLTSPRFWPLLCLTQSTSASLFSILEFGVSCLTKGLWIKKPEV